MADAIRVVADSPDFVPARQFPGDAGADLKAAWGVTIEPGECKKIGTGVRVAIPFGFAGLVFPRSGLATKKWLWMMDGVGLIDHGYTGEVMVPLCNLSVAAQRINFLDRIAQLVIIPVELSNFYVADSLPPTDRGEGGFGSTGV